MRDRQIFATKTLSNGISIYHYSSDEPFVLFYIRIPIGSVHCNREIPFGSIHLLEHVLLHRSNLYPEDRSFEKWLKSKGGSMSAVTEKFDTKFMIQIPSQYSEEAWHGLLSQVFEPIFNKEDIENERSIISSERHAQEYYPGNSKLGKYIWDDWMKTGTPSKRQIFGDDNDLSKITPLDLEAVHSLYFSKNVKVMVLGGVDNISYIHKSMEKLTTHKDSPREFYTPYSWGQVGYHTKTFKELSTPVYYVGTFFNKPPASDRVAIQFIYELLTDTYNSPLYRWLRHEKGWVYEIDCHHEINKYQTTFLLEIPLLDKKHITEVRQFLHKKVVAALSDKQLLTSELDRQLGQAVFEYQTLESIADDALYDIALYGKPVSDSTHKKHKKKCSDANYITNIYNKYFNIDSMKEFCALPV